MQYLYMLALLSLSAVTAHSETLLNEIVLIETVLIEPETLESSEYNAQLTKVLTADDKAALLLGQQISAIRHALDNPELPENLKIITELGTNQRDYTLVRGWLGYQLQGDMSILQASQEKTPEKIQQRIELLQQAIRRIDLE